MFISTGSEAKPDLLIGGKLYVGSNYLADPSGTLIQTSSGVLQVITGDGLGFAPMKMLKATMTALPVYANNAAAISGGLLAGDLYRTGGNPDAVCIVH
jgi:hypothetical protein